MSNCCESGEWQEQLPALLCTHPLPSRFFTSRSHVRSEGRPDLLLVAVDITDGARLARPCLVLPQDLESRQEVVDAFINLHLSTEDGDG